MIGSHGLLVSIRDGRLVGHNRNQVSVQPLLLAASLQLSLVITDDTIEVSTLIIFHTFRIRTIESVNS